MTSDARARIYKDRYTGSWTVARYWRGTVIRREQRRNWNDARAAAVWWVNA